MRRYLIDRAAPRSVAPPTAWLFTASGAQSVEDARVVRLVELARLMPLALLAVHLLTH